MFVGEWNVRKRKGKITEECVIKQVFRLELIPLGSLRYSVKPTLNCLLSG